MSLPELFYRLKQIILFNKFWLVAMSLLFLNVYMQYFQVTSITGFNIWDNHQLTYMSSPLEKMGTENAVESFQTYGPAFKYFYSFCGPFDSMPGYWFKIFFIALLLGIIILYLKGCELESAPFILSLFFILYNFPSLSYAPFVLILWSLALPLNGKLLQFHTIIGVLVTSLIFLYKPSWGVIAGMHLGVTAIAHPAFENWLTKLKMFLVYTLGSCILTTTLYLIMTERGTLYSWLTFLKVTMEDIDMYAHLMLYPLSFVENWFVLCYPLLICLTMACLSTFRIHDKKIWLVLILAPILFAEFKHSYVRADSTNLKGIFWFFPLTLFFVCLRFWGHTKLKVFLLSSLTLLVTADLCHLTPYNTPWRHPRQWWISTPDDYTSQAKTAQVSSKKHYAKYNEEMNWLNPYTRKGDLVVAPGFILLGTKGTTPRQLPSSQSFYAMKTKTSLDLDCFQYQRPEYFLFENVLNNDRIPLSHQPEMMHFIMTEAQLIKRQGDFFLFSWLQKQDHRIRKEQNLAQLQLDNGKCDFTFEAEKGALINIRTRGLIDLSYKLRSKLLRGEKLKMIYTIDGVSKKYLCAYTVFEKGFMMAPDLEASFSENKTMVQHRIQFTGHLHDDFPYDPGAYLFGQSQSAHLTLGRTFYASNQTQKDNS